MLLEAQREKGAEFLDKAYREACVFFDEPVENVATDADEATLREFQNLKREMVQSHNFAKCCGVDAEMAQTTSSFEQLRLMTLRSLLSSLCDAGGAATTDADVDKNEFAGEVAGFSATELATMSLTELRNIITTEKYGLKHGETIRCGRIAATLGKTMTEICRAYNTMDKNMTQYEREKRIGSDYTAVMGSLTRLEAYGRVKRIDEDDDTHDRTLERMRIALGLQGHSALTTFDATHIRFANPEGNWLTSEESKQPLVFVRRTILGVDVYVHASASDLTKLAATPAHSRWAYFIRYIYENKDKFFESSELAHLQALPQGKFSDMRALVKYVFLHQKAHDAGFFSKSLDRQRAATFDRVLEAFFDVEDVPMDMQEHCVERIAFNYGKEGTKGCVPNSFLRRGTNVVNWPTNRTDRWTGAISVYLLDDQGMWGSVNRVLQECLTKDELDELVEEDAGAKKQTTKRGKTTYNFENLNIRVALRSYIEFCAKTAKQTKTTFEEFSDDEADVL